MEETKAIIINGVKKKYRLGSIGRKTLQRDIQSRWALLRGKEDPNSRIGADSGLYGQTFMALDVIDLEINRGEAVGIIGPNGAGKSTLLKIISQITAPTEGEIDIYGRVTSMLEVGTGFHGEMTGRENVYMNGAILGMTKKEIDERMEEIISFSEIGEFIDTPVKRYSSGMFVKLAFSVAAHLNSEIMIMDEVLAVGDMAFQQKCLDKMREAVEVDGRTILYVSHNMNTIRRLCKRCIVLNQGKIIFDGDVEKAIALYMDRSLGGDGVNIDLTKLNHGWQSKNQKITMEHLKLVDKTSAVYEQKEPLLFDLDVQLKEKLKDVQVRITLRTDTDTGLGTSWSNDIDMSGLEKGTHVIRCKMDLSTVAKGVFYISIGIYQKDEIGREMMLDHVTRAFRIEIPGTLDWETAAQGNIRFPAAEANVVS